MQCEPIIVTELQRMEVCPVLAGQSGVLSPHRPVSYTLKCQCTGPERTIPFGLKKKKTYCVINYWMSRYVVLE